jgi:hypothetical protein
MFSRWQRSDKAGPGSGRSEELITGSYDSLGQAVQTRDKRASSVVGPRYAHRQTQADHSDRHP